LAPSCTPDAPLGPVKKNITSSLVVFVRRLRTSYQAAGDEQLAEKKLLVLREPARTEFSQSIEFASGV
jgi:hypothetical protein